MKFLIDECLSPKLAELARQRGYGESSTDICAWFGMRFRRKKDDDPVEFIAHRGAVNRAHSRRGLWACDSFGQCRPSIPRTSTPQGRTILPARLRAPLSWIPDRPERIVEPMDQDMPCTRLRAEATMRALRHVPNMAADSFAGVRT